MMHIFIGMCLLLTVNAVTPRRVVVGRKMDETSTPAGQLMYIRNPITTIWTTATSASVNSCGPFMFGSLFCRRQHRNEDEPVLLTPSHSERLDREDSESDEDSDQINSRATELDVQ